MYNPYQFLQAGLLGFEDPYANRQQPQGLFSQPINQMGNPVDVPMRSPRMIEAVAPIAMEPYGMTLDESTQAGLKKMIDNMKSGDPEYVGQFEPKDNYINTPNFRSNEMPSTYQTPSMNMNPQSAMGEEDERRNFKRRMLGISR
jgi:hypothetical protein